MRAISLGIWSLIALGTLVPMVSATPADPPATDLGRAIYEQRCLECHGPQGRGDGIKAPFLSPRPGNLVSAATSAKSDKDLLKIIANGRARTAMPAWKDQLSDQEQREVLRYIRSLVQFHHPLTPPPPDHSSP
jgi:mono/diheme cytochrome c family protein